MIEPSSQKRMKRVFPSASRQAARRVNYLRFLIYVTSITSVRLAP